MKINYLDKQGVKSLAKRIKESSGGSIQNEDITVFHNVTSTEETLSHSLTTTQAVTNVYNHDITVTNVYNHDITVAKVQE